MCNGDHANSISVSCFLHLVTSFWAQPDTILRISFSRLNGIPLNSYHIAFIHPLAGRCLGHVYILAIMNNATKIIGVTAIPFSHIARHGLLDHIVISSVKTLQTMLQNAYGNLQSQQQCVRVPISPHHSYLDKGSQVARANLKLTVCPRMALSS